MGTRLNERSGESGGNIELDLVDFTDCFFTKIDLCIQGGTEI